MTSLNIRNNSMGKEGSEAIAEALRANKVMKNLDMSRNNAGAKCAQILADGVIANGALASLDISNNSITHDQQMALQLKRICDSKGIDLVLWDEEPEEEMESWE